MATRTRRTAAPAVEAPKAEEPKVETPVVEAPKALAGGKLRWVFPEGKTQYPDGKYQVATLGENSYAITGETGSWSCLHTDGEGTETVLAEPGSFGRAYNAAVKHHKANRVVATPAS